MSENAVKEATEASFATEVLDRSHQVPVVVDFWADWCAPCRALSPVLERLAEEAAGSWILVKVDVDANPGLAAAFQVQGIPAVFAFRDGQPVAEFTGALPEAQVRSWLAQLGPSPADVAAEDAARLEEEGRLDEAADAYRRALADDPGHIAARQGLRRLEFRRRAAALDNEAAARRAASDPDDVDAILDLADLAASRQDFDVAFSGLVDALRRFQGPDRERIRVHLVDLFDLLPPDDPRVIAARRALFSALH